MSMTSTTDGFASVRESVTSRDAETTASTLDFEYVDLVTILLNRDKIFNIRFESYIYYSTNTHT